MFYKEKKTEIEEGEDQLELSVSVCRGIFVSFVVSVSETSSICCSEPAVVAVGIETTGEIIAGEFRCCCCCSCSYSLIKRFFNGCALFDETDVVGEADDDTGDAIVGGVLPLTLLCIG